jgi:putative hydrolase of the HAD superfamily
MRPHGSPGSGQFPGAVLLDALGTLVELDDPWAALARELRGRGAAVTTEEARSALLEEMAYYRAHHDEAGDAEGLESLRDRCALVLRDALPSHARDLPTSGLRDALLAALRFRAFPDAAPALAALRSKGCRLGVVSNWDVSLHEVLRSTGLAERVDVVLTSAQEGVAKPDPEIFVRALHRLGGVDPRAALHVGDELESDVRGALAAGLGAVLIDRDGTAGEQPGVSVVRSLADLVPSRR